ncbi:MAG: tRNA (adenine57-N1/adenine58-N1)-methyltransferase, partial [Hyphomicrobiaceae bacterium]
LKTLRAGHRMTVRGTIVAADELIGRSEGILAGAGQPERFRVFRPSLAELTPLLTRAAEPVFAKDAATVLIRGDIRPGQRVIEVGVGAGALSMVLLRALGPNGHLTTYELREDLAAGARTTVATYAGLGEEPETWNLRIGDARDGFQERDVDRIVADMPEPGTLLDVVAEALVPGGIFTSYVPTVVQLKQTHDALTAHPLFTDGETFEILERTWVSAEQSLRPDHRMVAHTGFVTIARRLEGRTAARPEPAKPQEP